ncbi:hypothetical protein KR009_009438 [Drosophila setifemur]|nr:hypothetical protein KR009_009438 [Drosophila setifemur]
MCCLFISVLFLVISPAIFVKIRISHISNTMISSTPPTTTESSTITFYSLPEVTSSLSIFPPRSENIGTTIPSAATTTKTLSHKGQPINTTELTASEPILKNYTQNYCSCDIQVGKCDQSCCCDTDCDTEALHVFNCPPSTSSPQLQSKLEDFQYAHSLPTCRFRDGWLCIFRINRKQSKAQPHTASFDTVQNRKWPDPLGTYEMDPPQTPSSSFYKFGEPLQLWQPEFGQLTTLELPIGYENSHCQLKQPVRHLQPMSSYCLMKDFTQLQETLWGMLNISASRLLLHKPRDPADQEFGGLLIKVCRKYDHGKLHCQEQGNGPQLDVLAESVELQLIHNFKSIIEAKLLIKKASLKKVHNDPIWLHYKVTFITVNESLVKSTSGPFGYVQGYPIILSKFLAQNSTENNQMLSYFNDTNNFEEIYWLHLLSRRPQSMVCERTTGDADVLMFGVDIEKHCQLIKATPLLQEIANHTKYCQDLQTEIWKKLLPLNCSHLQEVNQVSVSQMGRPQPNKWLPMQLHYPGNVSELPLVQGIYNEVDQTLSCRNVFLSVRYEFHVEDMTLQNRKFAHQRVVQHARIVLGQRQDLEFDDSEQQVVFPLSVSVMFYNMMEKPLNGATKVAIPDQIWRIVILNLMVTLFKLNLKIIQFTI